MKKELVNNPTPLRPLLDNAESAYLGYRSAVGENDLIHWALDQEPQAKEEPQPPVDAVNSQPIDAPAASKPDAGMPTEGTPEAKALEQEAIGKLPITPEIFLRTKSEDEEKIIYDAAMRQPNGQVEPNLLAALRLAENGPDGIEYGFGVDADGRQNPKWIGLDKQAGAAAYQINAVEQRYEANVGQPTRDEYGWYTDEFIKYFSAGGPGYPGYSPVTAHPKNKNHTGNLLFFYKAARETRDAKIAAGAITVGGEVQAQAEPDTLFQGSVKPADPIGALSEGPGPAAPSLLSQLADKTAGAVKSFLALPLPSAATQAISGLTGSTEPVTVGKVLETLNIPFEHVVGLITKGDIREKGTIDDLKATLAKDPVIGGALKQYTPDQQAAALSAIALGFGMAIDPLGWLPFGKAKKAAEAVSDLGKARKGLTPAEAATPLDDIAKTYRQTVEDFRRGVRHQPESRVEGEALVNLGRFGKADVERMYPGTTLDDAHIAALQTVLTGEGSKLQTLAAGFLSKSIMKGPEADAARDAFLQQFATLGTLHPRMIGVEAETGRSLSFLNNEKDTIRNFVSQFGPLLGKVRVGMSPERLAALVSEIKTVDEMATFTRNYTKPGYIDMALELWVNGLLSGPKTITTNLIGNSVTLVGSVFERGAASMVNRMLPGSGVVPGETMALMRGYLGSFGDAWEAAWQSFKTDQPRFGVTKLDSRPRMITSENLQKADRFGIGYGLDYMGSLIGMGGDRVGTIARAPGRILMSSDEWFKAMAYRGELGAQSWREAWNDGLSQGLRGKDLREFVKGKAKEIELDPPSSIAQAAREHAFYTTFTKELGDVGQHVQAISAHPLGKIVLPFVRTPANIFKYAGERTPLAIFSKAVRNDIAAGGAARDLALAKLALGSGTMAMVGTAAAAGFITGSGPDRPEVNKIWRTAGYQPYSVNISALRRGDGQPQEGDEWISYNRVDPIGMVFGLASDWALLAGHLDEKEAGDLALGVAASLSQNFTSKTYVKGLSETLNALSDPGKRGEKLLETLTRSLEPAVVRELARTADPILRETHSMIDVLKAGIPGLSKSLPPRRNFWGEPIILQGGLGPDMLSPLYRSEHIDDPVVEELVKIKIPLDMPSRNVGNVELGPEGYDAYVKLFGQGKLIGGRTLHKDLEALFNSRMYQSIPEDRRADEDGLAYALIRSRVRAYKQAAEMQLRRENPDIDAVFKSAVKDKISRMTERQPVIGIQ